MLEPGDNLLVVHRRLFETDQSRFFVGRVEAYQDGIVRVRGYSFARDSMDGNVCRKNQSHTKLYAIGSGTLLTYVIGSEVNVDQVKLEAREGGLCLTDGREFSMNISEWIHHF
jgi:hypothetical protein